jgi:hypothetical protein
MCRIPSSVRSDVYAEPVFFPISTRTPAPREPDSFRAFDLAHADAGRETVAGRYGTLRAGRTTRLRHLDDARRQIFEVQAVPPTGHAVEFDGGDADTHWDALTFFAADPNALIELQVVADHRHVLQRFRTIANERCSANGCGYLAVLDQIAF